MFLKKWVEKIVKSLALHYLIISCFIGWLFAQLKSKSTIEEIFKNLSTGI
jgi:hypothetical protein